ncbi:MAG: hypothetical protein CL819_09010 [Croceicoccus sp.]|nr:hypothetical protein [Croceicoccus sp.]
MTWDPTKCNEANRRTPTDADTEVCPACLGAPYVKPQGGASQLCVVCRGAGVVNVETAAAAKPAAAAAMLVEPDRSDPTSFYDAFADSAAKLGMEMGAAMQAVAKTMGVVVDAVNETITITAKTPPKTPCQECGKPTRRVCPYCAAPLCFAHHRQCRCGNAYQASLASRARATGRRRARCRAAPTTAAASAPSATATGSRRRPEPETVDCPKCDGEGTGHGPDRVDGTTRQGFPWRCSTCDGKGQLPKAVAARMLLEASNQPEPRILILPTPMPGDGRFRHYLDTTKQPTKGKP